MDIKTMECTEDEDTMTLAQLLVKRRKLLDLRKNLINNTEKNSTEGPVEVNENNSNPVTPHSIFMEQPSISPPPYSPLTPLISKLLKQSNNEQDQSIPDQSIPVTTQPEIHDPSITPNRSSPSSSPLPLMSPETQQLFDMLDKDDNIFKNRCISDLDYNSDDSVMDPNFVMPNKADINESTSCSSIDINESNKTSTNNLTRSEERYNNIDAILEPVSSVTPSDEVLNRQASQIILQEETSLNDMRSDAEIGRLKKGRKRINPQLRLERKYNKYNNLEYTTFKNETVKPKKIINYNCYCSKNCPSLVSVENRKEEFEKFVKLGSFNAQLLYIVSHVKEYNKKRTYSMNDVPAERKKPKQFSRIYLIKNIAVCRNMFLKTFQITTQKVTTALKKNRTGASISDDRGIKSGGYNKMSNEDRDFIIDIINKLPKYESHYRRENNNGALYLQPGMTLKNIYNEYLRLYAQQNSSERKCASFETLKKIFYSNFNLRCKKLKKDTCNKCDKLSMKIESAETIEKKTEYKNEKFQHIERAENLRNHMKLDFKEAQTLPNVECLTFDLEKTLPLPRIATNVAFYKRQLWIYNCGIHSASDDVGHCFVWVEGDAGRGAQEVGSCLLKFIGLKLRPTVEHLILWSDCCGGQNRNIKIVLMLKAALNCHPTLQTVTFKYLESGHTFLPNDTDFSKIETALKHHQSIFTVEEYIEIFKNAKKKKPLQVHRMERTSFYSTIKLEKNVINRKKFLDKSKVNWLTTKEIKIEKNKMFSIFMKSSNDTFKELQIEKKNRGDFLIITSELSSLWPNGKPIAPEKLADLESMYDYIPANCLQFYKNLKCSDEVSDDLQGFGGEPDFDLQEDEANL